MRWLSLCEGKVQDGRRIQSRQCDKRGGGGGGAPGGRNKYGGGVSGLTVMLTDRGRLAGGGGGRACQTTPRGVNSVARWCWLVIITVVACANGAQGEDFTYKFSVEIGIKNQFKCKFCVKTSSNFNKRKC